MADISDVLNAIGAFLGTILYPSGASGEAASPVAGCPVLVQAGWPDPKTVDVAVGTGKVLVTLFPGSHERNTTRYPETREENPIPATSWTLTASGQTLTVGGANTAPWTAQNLCAFVNGKPYVYQPVATDTADTAAAALEAKIAADVAGVTIAGAVITLPAAARIGAVRIGALGSTVREVRRVERQVSIIIWAGTPLLRDAVAKVIDPALSDARKVTLADQTVGRLTYSHSLVVDSNEKDGIYRRDLIFAVEFGTSITEQYAQVVANLVETTDPWSNVISDDYS